MVNQYLTHRSAYYQYKNYFSVDDKNVKKKNNHKLNKQMTTKSLFIDGSNQIEKSTPTRYIFKTELNKCKSTFNSIYKQLMYSYGDLYTANITSF